MSKYLFGPVSRTFAEENLSVARQAGECLTFDTLTRADLQVSEDDSWESLLSRCPAGWRPDFLVLWLAYANVPAWIWSAPVPLIGLAADWNLLWHYYRRVLPRCDLVLTDRPGVEVMKRAGIVPVAEANLFGLGQSYLDPQQDAERDIDLFFAGNLHPAVQRERMSWLGDLSQFGDRWKVRIASGVFGEEYRALLGRSRIVFNRSVRGECNRRTFEAPACGALLFQEAGNAEVAQWLQPGREYIEYTPESFRGLIEHYLTHEDERRSIAEAGRNWAINHTFARLWSDIVKEIEPKLADGSVRRNLSKRVSHDSAMKRTDDLIAATTLADALTFSDNKAKALDQIQKTLDLLPQAEAWDEDLREAEIFLPEFDFLRVEWERAGWSNAGNPRGEERDKRHLLTWHLRLLQADLTKELGPYYEAVLARSDLPSSRAALGCALARAGKFHDARDHLAVAVKSSPFDLEAVRALAQTLEDAGDQEGLAKLVHQRRLLAETAPQIVPWEDWFAPPPPEANGLVSIIVVSCNQADLTRACLESVCRNTRPPFQLILVDNGSSDETLILLESVKSWAGPANVAVLRSQTNLGFARGVNLGLKQVNGVYVALLNNDTRVPEGWLEGLIRWMHKGGPRVGLVGPVSNYAPPPQGIAGGSDPSTLATFAKHRREGFADQGSEVSRLTGFCLLTRREVWEQLDGLDEQFGLGFFEDDDLCLRAMRAGWRLILGEDVFIYHVGSQTFQGLGVDISTQLANNLEMFRRKWGDEIASRFRMPDGQPALASADTKRLRVSLAMIVKNEERNLKECLEGLSEIFNEIIVVDTGSSDRTRELARSLGAVVYDFPWIDSFAAARNESLRHATGDWVFWLDADDRLDTENRRKLKDLFSTLKDENAAYVMKCLCPSRPGSQNGTVVDHVRLFRRSPNLRWKYRVHEQILGALRAVNADVRWAEVLICHVGYQEPALRQRKLERDLRLIQLDRDERPDDPFVLFNLGSIFHEMGRHAEALPLLERSVELSHPSDSIVRKLYALIANCWQELGRWDQAVAACQAGAIHYPDDAELLYTEGVLHLERGDLISAESCLLRLLQTRPSQHFASVDSSLRGFRGRHQLALVYHRQGRLTEAEQMWLQVVHEQPQHGPSWQGLAELYRSMGRLEMAAQAEQRLR